MKQYDFVIGTTNPGKVAEIAAIINSYGDATLERVASFDIPETSWSFLENAMTKGREYAYRTKKYAISEDSGLIVPALKGTHHLFGNHQMFQNREMEGLPGQYSARFYAVQLSQTKNVLVINEDFSLSREEIDLRNNLRVLEMMKDVTNRIAYFHVALVVHSPDGKCIFSAESRTSGTISTEMRGDNGFGYDPIFIGDDTYGSTYAELDSARKNLRSHRKKVLREFRQWLNTPER